MLKLVTVSVSLAFLLSACGGVEPVEEEVSSSEAACKSKFKLQFDKKYKRLIWESYFTGSEGKPLRYKVYKKLGPVKAHVIFLNGQHDFMELYDVLWTSKHEYPQGAASAAETLADMPVSVVTLDHTGQGKSQSDRIPGHIEDFSTFVEDVRLLVQKVRFLRKHKKPIYIMGHSMGGLISVLFSQAYPDKVDGIILSSPGLKLATPPGTTDAQMMALMTAMVSPPPYGFGFGDRCAFHPSAPLPVVGMLVGCLSDPGCAQCFANPTLPGCDQIGMPWQTLHTAWAFLNSPASVGCSQNPMPVESCDPTNALFNGRTTDFNYCYYGEAHANNIVGPTYGWVTATSTAQMGLAAGMGNIAMKPMLMLSTPIDPLVDYATNAQVCSALPFCTHEVFVPSAQGVYFHDLLRETARANVIGKVRAWLNARL